MTLQSEVVTIMLNGTHSAPIFVGKHVGSMPWGSRKGGIAFFDLAEFFGPCAPLQGPVLPAQRTVSDTNPQVRPGPGRGSSTWEKVKNRALTTEKKTLPGCLDDPWCPRQSWARGRADLRKVKKDLQEAGIAPPSPRGRGKSAMAAQAEMCIPGRGVYCTWLWRRAPCLLPGKELQQTLDFKKAKNLKAAKLLKSESPHNQKDP